MVVNDRQPGAATIDLWAALQKAFSHWKWLVLAALFGLGIALAFAWSMPKLFRAQVQVAQVQSGGRDSLSGLANQFGGLAALAGISLGGGGQGEEAFATLTSRAFSRDFIVANGLAPVLFSDRWDPKTRAWKLPSEAPSLEECVDLFVKKVRSVVEDKKTRLLTVSVDWRDPGIAASWANSMIEMANSRMRESAIRDAEQNVKYLEVELRKTNVVELQQAIYRLMEAQVNQAMLATVQRQYAFRVIDRAVPPEKHFSPNSVRLAAVGTFLSVFVALVAFTAYYAFRQMSVSENGRQEH